MSDSPREACDATHACPGRFTWIGMSEPSEVELEDVAKLYELHPLAVEDAVHAHQRPKLERYDGSLLVVLKTLRYVDHDEVFELGEVLIFVGVDYVITVRHGQGCDLAAIRRQLEADPERLAIGPAEVLHTIADHVVDVYEDAASQRRDRHRRDPGRRCSPARARRTPSGSSGSSARCSSSVRR